MQDALAELYAAPLTDFVAERKRLAAQLRAAGDKDGAAALAKVAKPSPAAWALNHVARSAPDAVAAWLDAAEELRDASTRSAEVGGDALRAAMAAHRSASAKLRAVVREQRGVKLSEPMLDRVSAMLQAATADAVIADALRAGVITEDAKPAPSAPPPKAAAHADDAALRAERQAAEARAELETRASELRDRLAAARELLDERKSAARAAVRRQEDARRALRRSESELGAAEAAVSDTEDTIATDEAALAEIREELRQSGP